MEALTNCQSILQSGVATSEQALAAFDSLEPVNLDFMTGRWKGAEIRSAHPIEGVLESSGWYGKEFIDAETVHPLLVRNGKDKVIKIAPNPFITRLTLNYPAIASNIPSPLVRLTNSLLKTEASHARLRMMEYRGTVSATMIYDDLPINDVFRKVDDSTVFGVMDYKEISQPFFFTLRRVIEASLT
ncbi:MAG: DUF4334 domain-containing protein [Cyanobacteria bacterium P01_F01_bin.3]